MAQSVRRTNISALIVALATIPELTYVLTPAPAIGAGAPPFCVLRGGTNGAGGSPQICAYFEYQACLQAAADMHGNCVQNIDYHGEVSTAPVAARVRHLRHRT